MECSLWQIARFLGMECPKDRTITGVATLDEAGPGDLSFLANPRYESSARNTRAAAVLVPKGFEPPDTDTLFLESANPYLDFARWLRELERRERESCTGVDPAAHVHADASIDPGCYIGPGAVVERDARIGERSVVEANAHVGADCVIGTDCVIAVSGRVLRGCTVGNHVRIQSGALIGSVGFGYAPNEDGQYERIPHLGNVVLEDYVEIGANCTIDRGTLSDTVIATGVKLDNLVQVAHNVRIGAHTVIAAQAGIAGSTVVGKHCLIGGQAGIVGHLRIGNNVEIVAQSGVMRDVPDGAVVMGSPAIDKKEYLRAYAAFRKRGR